LSSKRFFLIDSNITLRQIATGHFVDLNPSGIFFNLLLKSHFSKDFFIFEDNNI
jgi:hypothetical protein